MKKVQSLLLVSMVLLFGVQVSANAEIKAGSKCTKLGQIKVDSGKKFVCIKKNKSLVWDKGTPIPKPSPSITPTTTSTPSPSPSPTSTNTNKSIFANPCSEDPLVPQQWKAMQDYYLTLGTCLGLYRINSVNLGNVEPKSPLSAPDSTVNLETCKIKNINPGARNQAFPNAYDSQFWKMFGYPAPKMVIQIIPIFSKDSAKPIGSPKSDYQKYFDFLKEWIEYSSDVSSNVEIRIPSSYIEFTKDLSPYGISHERSDKDLKPFTDELLKIVDPQINFAGSNFSLVVVPPGTDLDVIYQANLGVLATNDGVALKGGVLPPETFPKNSKFNHIMIMQPNWMIHELFHVGVGLDDRYGNSNFYNNYYAGNFEDSGLGGLTLMSTARSDLSAWEKWLMGFIADDQVVCVSASSPKTIWLAPSTYKTNKVKLAVLPISSTKVIVFESIRNGGLNYKLDSKSFGVFAYVIDTKLNTHGSGMQGIYPDGRSAKYTGREDIFYADAPFKVGESKTIEGFKISVVESGDFGDVIKIEK